jgi:hypothetical protein
MALASGELNGVAVGVRRRRWPARRLRDPGRGGRAEADGVQGTGEENERGEATEEDEAAGAACVGRVGSGRLAWQSFARGGVRQGHATTGGISRRFPVEWLAARSVDRSLDGLGAP